MNRLKVTSILMVCVMAFMFIPLLSVHATSVSQAQSTVVVYVDCDQNGNVGWSADESPIFVGVLQWDGTPTQPLPQYPGEFYQHPDRLVYWDYTDQLSGEISWEEISHLQTFKHFPTFTDNFDFFIYFSNWKTNFVYHPCGERMYLPFVTK
jgi:hypothetical protein